MRQKPADMPRHSKRMRVDNKREVIFKFCTSGCTDNKAAATSEGQLVSVKSKYVRNVSFLLKLLKRDAEMRLRGSFAPLGLVTSCSL